MKETDSHRYVLTVILCGICLVGTLLFTGTFLTVYTAVIATDLGLRRSVYSIFYTFRSLTAFVVSIYIYWLLKKISVKSIIMVGLAANAGALWLLSITKSFSPLIPIGILAGVGCALGGIVPISVILRNWFKKGYGTALAIASSFSGFGGVVFSPILSRFITCYGWRSGYRLLAISCVFIIIIELFFLKDDPQEAGLERIGGQDEQPVHGGASTLKVFGGGRDSVNLLLLVVMGFGFTFGGLSAYSNAAPVLQEAGFAAAFATGTAISVISLANCTGKVIMGEVNDRYGPGVMALVWYFLSCAATFLFAVYIGNSIIIELGILVLIGIQAGIYSTPVPTLCNYLYLRKEDYTKAVGIASGAVNLASSVSGLIIHGIYDLTGNYHGSLYFSFGMSVVSFATAIFLLTQNREKMFKMNHLRSSEKRKGE